jgi:hypothetical protein
MIAREDVDRIIAAYESGRSVPSIAAATGIAEGTCYHHLRKSGAVRPRGKLSPEQRAEICAAYRHGDREHGFRALGSRYGVSATCVWKIIRGLTGKKGRQHGT